MLLNRHKEIRQVNVQVVEKQPDTKPVVEEEKVEAPVVEEEKKSTRRSRK